MLFVLTHICLHTGDFDSLIFYVIQYTKLDGSKVYMHICMGDCIRYKFWLCYEIVWPCDCMVSFAMVLCCFVGSLLWMDLWLLKQLVGVATLGVSLVPPYDENLL